MNENSVAVLIELLRRARVRGESVLILGIGNPLRGDDGAGPAVAESLAQEPKEKLFAAVAGIALENVTHLVARHQADLLILVDAVASESLAPGQWDFFPVEELDSICHTAHSLPLYLLVSLWREDRPGIDIRFVGIGIEAPADFATLSIPVEKAVKGICSLINQVWSVEIR